MTAICTHYQPSIKRGCELSGSLCAPRDCATTCINRLVGCLYDPAPWRANTTDKWDRLAVEKWDEEMTRRNEVRGRIGH
jgi:hypothetical protein